jgi:MFS family permease
MLDSYRAALRPPGVLQFSAAAFVMRFALAMYPIGFVLLISLRTGHYRFAGVLSGVYVVANGIGNPALGRVADRFGQRRVLLPASAVHVAAVAVVIALAQVKAADWTLVPPTIVCGFSYLAVGSLVRARWSYVLAGRPELVTGYSIESTLDEVIFTLGPLVTTVLATQIDPAWAFGLAAALVAGGAVWLQSQRSTEPPAHPADAAPHASALRTPGMVLVTLAAAGMGAVFAGAEVSMVAFCGQRGHTSLAGLTIACFAFGSATAGFVYGARVHADDVLRRYVRQSVVFAVLPLLFLASVDIPVVAGIALVVGTAIAPLLITAFGLIERLVPANALTEGMSWLTMGLGLGYGIAASITGAIADAFGARPAFLVAIGAGMAVGVLGFAVRARVDRPPADRADRSTSAARA